MASQRVKWSNIVTLFILLVFASSAPGESATSQNADRVLPASTDLPPTTPPLPGIGPPLPLSLANAISLTLQKNQNIRLQREVVLQTQGQLQEATGAFDTTVIGMLQGSYTTSDNDEETSYNDFSQLNGATDTPQAAFMTNVEDAVSGQIALQRLFRNGITLAPQVTFSDDLTSVTGESVDSTNYFVGFYPLRASTLAVPS